MWYLLAAAIVVLAGASRATSFSVLPDLVPVRARGGALYRDALANAARFTSTRNTTANIWRNAVVHGVPSRGTFAQRWWADYTSWSSPSSPVLLYISGEGPASGSPGGYAAALGAELGCLLITLEHRNYGDSMVGPLTDKLALETLNIKTVMEDLAAFARFVEAEVLPAAPKKRTWIVVGGSYAGGLAAWARETHPELFDMAWSSSGVVHPIFDFTAFDDVIVRDLPTACASSIRDAQAEAMAAWGNADTRAAALALFDTPSYFTQRDFAWMLADSVAMGPQYGAKASMCSFFTPGASPSDSLKSLARWTVAHYGPSFGSSCYYSSKCLSDPTMSEQWAGAGYAWVYQCCSQMSWWQAANGPSSLRSSVLTSAYWTSQCEAAFGSTVTPQQVDAFNAQYGGAAPNATHVVALNGSDDPWQGACVNATLSASYVEATATCDGCGHCGDLSTPSGTAPPAIIAQQALVKAYLSAWVAEAQTS